jgi:hypothetical protein
MANEVPPVPYKEPPVDQNGVLTPAWAKWFERVRLLLRTSSGGGGGGAVDSVNGHTGVVVLDKTDIGLGSVNNTADSAKPVSTLQAAAIAVVQLDVDTHEADIANPHAVTKAQVGLGSVDNTSDSAKPVSTAQQTALNLKADLSSPALTGTPTAPTATAGTTTTQIATTAFVQGQGFVTATTAPVTSVASKTGAVTLVKGDVGLGNVDNTSDATKNAAVATLTNKTLTSPVINSPTGIVKGDVGLGNVDNTSDATKNAAAVTLTNKTIASPTLTGTTTAGDINSSGTVSASTLSVTNNATVGGSATITTSLDSVGPVHAYSTLQVDGQLTAGATLKASAALLLDNATDSTTTGSNAALAFTTASKTLTNTSLTSIGTITNNAAGKTQMIVNATGAAITLINEYSSGTAAQRITTGTGLNMVLPNGASAILHYSTSDSRWHVIGNPSAGSGSVSSINPVTVQRLTASGTYTTPAGVKFLKVRAIGGGGGGQGSANGAWGTVGAAGGATSFGSLISCPGGGGGNIQGNNGGATPTISSPAIAVVSMVGNPGGAGFNKNGSSSPEADGGTGGASPFGGAGAGLVSSATAGSATANSGSGGGGSGTGASATNSIAGQGGGSGAYAEAFIVNPATSYSVTIGGAGAGGVGSLATGGAGGSGVIIVEEYYVSAGTSSGQPVSLRAYNSGTNQTLTSSTITTMTLNATKVDTSGSWSSSNSYFVTPVSDFYELFAMAVAATGTITATAVYYTINGGTEYTLNYCSGSNSASGSDVTWLNAGDIVRFRVNMVGTGTITVQGNEYWSHATINRLGSTNVASNMVVDVFAGTGAQTAFTLSADPVTRNNTFVSIDGVLQAKSTYTTSGTTLTFSEAPPSSSVIEVASSTAITIGTPSDGTVTRAKLDTASAFIVPTVQKFTSGTGTYTTPANVKYLKVKMVGGGGAGSGSGTGVGSANGSAGTASTFGGTVLVANGGGLGSWSSTSIGGTGGTASLGAGAVGTAIQGSSGGPSGFNNAAGYYAMGGSGGASVFGGAGPGGGTEYGWQRFYCASNSGGWWRRSAELDATAGFI